VGGEGSGFSRFPPLAVGQGESQQPTDSPLAFAKSAMLTPRIQEGWEKQRPAMSRLFPCSRTSVNLTDWVSRSACCSLDPRPTRPEALLFIATGS
jgi:hypothetical protein